jgi:hypothetical protein
MPDTCQCTGHGSQDIETTTLKDNEFDLRVVQDREYSTLSLSLVIDLPPQLNKMVQYFIYCDGVTPNFGNA